MNAVNVPVTISPEASARVAELGLQAELECMIQHALRTVPRLVGIEAFWYERADEDSPPAVKVVATTAAPSTPARRLYWDILDWQGETFPPEVREHLSLTLVHTENGDARE